ncbi:MAG: hypothetical protein II951_07045 [Bacteroidales bacterium]|nr:hypothetical protein [Bacteroidales bacterium]
MKSKITLFAFSAILILSLFSSIAGAQVACGWYNGLPVFAEEIVKLDSIYFDSVEESVEEPAEDQVRGWYNGEQLFTKEVDKLDSISLRLLGQHVVINLPHIKGDAFIQSFYQACTDWVWDYVDTKAGFTIKGQGYVTSYGNNEYYTGSSAYQNDVDWRPDNARRQFASGYEGMTDEQVVEQMKKNLIEAWAGALLRLYPYAKLLSGFTYTINFTAYYIGLITASDHEWTIDYKIVDGRFQYVEGSLKEVQLFY